MFILERNEGFPYEMRKVERSSIVHCKLLAEVDVLLIQAIDLGRNEVNRVLVILDIILDIFIVFGHHFFTHLIKFLHLIEVEA